MSNKQTAEEASAALVEEWKAQKEQTTKEIEPQKDQEEEAQVEQVEEVPEEKSEGSSIEDQAKALGWKPADEMSEEELEKLQSKGKVPIPADEFVRNQTYIDRIEELNKSHKEEMQDMKKLLKELSDQVSSAQEIGYKKALKEIEAKKLEAVEEGDLGAFEAADQEYNDLKEEMESKVKPVEQPQEPSVPQEFLDFDAKHKSWVDSHEPEDLAMQMEVSLAAQELTKLHPDIQPAKMVQALEHRLQTKFPHRFGGNKARKKAPAVSTASEPVAKTREKYTFNDLSSTQQMIYRDLSSKVPGYTIEKYVDGLKNSGRKIGD